MEFEGRVAVVTGGTGALGRAVVLDLLRAGAQVAVPYLQEAGWNELRALAGGHRDRLTGGAVDLTDPGQVDRFIDETAAKQGDPDFLVCAAGGFAVGRSYESDARAWERMLTLNLRSVVLILKPVLPRMIRRNFGRLVTVSSGAILSGGGAGMAAYAVSKGAVKQLTEILAREVEAYDIRAHCVMPGTMDTEANRRAMPKADPSQWVKTEQVAEVIHFLLGEKAAAVRSAIVPVLG